MPPWLLNFLQQFGRDIITSAPDAAQAAKREHATLRDPYVNKSRYWFGRGGAAELDADDHRLYDRMTQVQRDKLAAYKASGTCGTFNQTKLKYRRPWTGAWSSLLMKRD